MSNKSPDTAQHGGDLNPLRRLDRGIAWAHANKRPRLASLLKGLCEELRQLHKQVDSLSGGLDPDELEAEISNLQGEVDLIGRQLIDAEDQLSRLHRDVDMIRRRVDDLEDD